MLAVNLKVQNDVTSTKVVIHPPAYQHNLEILRKQLPNTTLLCAVVKADAYGHGIDLLAPVAAESGVHYLGIVDSGRRIVFARWE